MILEQILIYGTVFLLCAVILWVYLLKLQRESRTVAAKIRQAKEEGLFEPVSLHPVIDLNTCIKSGACVAACPEKDIIGIVNGRATLVNASQCVGHGACFHACPVEAISLVIGTEKRGVDLPHVNEEFESNVPGIFIAGELGGMGLIKNSVEQGQQAVASMLRAPISKTPGVLDLVIVGAGPAGVSAALMAKKHQLEFMLLEQDSLGGTVSNFPRSKIVMTAPMELPLYGKIRLFETSKQELLALWHSIFEKYGISVKEHTKVEEIYRENGHFTVSTNQGDHIKAKRILLAIGRRGSPRKLGIAGEELEKVAYRLLEPELISGKQVVVVGGGDSAIEAALSLCSENEVILSYRNEAFNRLKPKNKEKLEEALKLSKLKVHLQSYLQKIEETNVTLAYSNGLPVFTTANDLVFIFAGGELPTDFLKKVGVEITTRFGYTVKKH